ncbi:MAG: hypothetical protein U0169_00680 [Polyangiaceae bacterium]
MNARRLLGGLLAGTSLLAAAGVTRDASAWDKTEHDAIVASAYRLACLGHERDLPFCDRSNGDFAIFATTAGRAARETDLCHSFWFSDLAIEMNGANADQRGSCAIIDGVGYTDPSAYQFFGANTYFVRTNSNHFGAHAVTHMKHWLALADLAARRYVAAPAHLKNTCGRAAVALAGRADHFMTDRTAAGHAFTPNPRGMLFSAKNDAMTGMLGCLHGQSAVRRAVVSYGTGFDCMDGAYVNSEVVWDGFGRSGRVFGDSFYGDEKLWWSDDAWNDTVQVPGKGSVLQKTETVGSATSLFQSVFATMVGTKDEIRSSPTYLSNYETCRVLWGECCRSFSAQKGPNGSWDDPDIRVSARCDYCAPDVSDATLKDMCPAKDIRRDKPKNAGGVWKMLYGDSEWVNYYTWWPRRGDSWTGSYYYAVELDRPKGDWSGTDVARTIMAREEGLVHPDARWDKSHDVVALLGCRYPGMPEE